MLKMSKKKLINNIGSNAYKYKVNKFWKED